MFLRPKFLYPKKFYYFAAVTNLIMRLAWLVHFFKYKYMNTYLDWSQWDIMILSIIEGLRRAQWALIRIENENVNNFERYRNVLQIPEFKEMMEDQDDKGNKQRGKR